MNRKRALTVFVTVVVLLLGTGPVNGRCDLLFSLWDAPSDGSQQGADLEIQDVELVDGLFTARLDFGAHAGGARWLQVAVRCPTGRGGSVTLSPRPQGTGMICQMLL